MSKIKIVIADDHGDFRQLLVRFLSRDFEVLDSVEHGMELIGSAVVLNPDVIVSDICMPRLTGPEAMDELNTRGLHIPFVFISSDEHRIGPEALFVRKEDILKELVPAIFEAASGQPNSSFVAPGKQHGPSYSVNI